MQLRARALEVANNGRIAATGHGEATESTIIDSRAQARLEVRLYPGARNKAYPQSTDRRNSLALLPPVGAIFLRLS